MIERVPNQEDEKVPTREAVVESLRADNRDFSKLMIYANARGEELTGDKGNILLAVEIAEIYRDAGMKNKANEAIQEAIELAEKVGDLELHDRIIDEAEKLAK